MRFDREAGKKESAATDGITGLDSSVKCLPTCRSVRFENGVSCILVTMIATAPIACIEKQRLLQAYTAAVAECNRLQSAQVSGLLQDDGFDFEMEIAKAGDRREQAKYAILAHQQEHGC